MKLCKGHIEQIEQVVRDAGFGDRIAESDEEAAEMLARGVGDPSRAVQGLILIKSMQVWGEASVLVSDCPLCKVITTVENCKCGKPHSKDEGLAMVTTWIDRSMDYVRALAERESSHAGSSTIQ